ncbi:sister chromatid cohesion protein PDS5 homolog D-like isoform X2 [Apium graveolens]|uniref:sister chromatid cohesion protein PDS5 homolog D-like isoform X2 n=1 Tax=Apium graveolens TaxID=4045 RepID=UPI003D7AB8B1
MASSPTITLPPCISEEELEEELTDVGNKLLKPPFSTEEVLKLLDELGCLLSKVTQEPSHSMLDSLKPAMKALMGTEILMHYDTDVKVWVASCLSEIARILAPNAPYSDEEMKNFFQLCIVAVEQLSNMSARSYLRAVLVLRTLASIRLCVLMLDLELDDLILKMFERFLDIKSQPDAILSDMERIMTLIVEESEECSFELLSILLKSVKRENQNVSPFSWELGQKVLKNCAGILGSDIPKAVNSMGIALNDFADIVASICQAAPKTDNAGIEKLLSEDISIRKHDEDAGEQPKSGMIGGGSDTPVQEISLANCQQTGATPLSNSQANCQQTSATPLSNCQQTSATPISNSQANCQQTSATPLSNSQAKDKSKEAMTQPSPKKRGRKPNSLRKEEEGYDNTWVIGISSSNKTPSRGKNPRKRSNPSNSSSLAGLTSPAGPGKEPKSLAFSVKNVQGASLPSPLSGNCSIPENVHPGPQSGVHQKEKLNSSMNTDNGLNLLSVSVEDLFKTENEETPAQVAPKISGSSGNPRGKRKKGVVNTGSQGDAKPKRRRAVKKNEIERTGDAAEKHGEDMTPTQTDGISRSRETRTKFPVLQLDAGIQKLGRSAPIGHATEQPGDRSEFGGATKDPGEELVGRKIKVWWPADDQFYKGVITGFDPERKKHKVEYVDGDEENLYLRAERWEIVEDEEDSEATEDTRPPIVSSASRFPGAEAGSSHPRNLIEKASVAHQKNRTSASWELGGLVRNKLKADGVASGKRTKRRTLHGEQGNKSSANDQVVEASNIPVDVGGYRVKAANAPILRSILAKYGDIAAHCMFTSAAVRASMLEVICDIVKRLQSNNVEDNMLQLEAMENEVRDAEAAKIEVSWLQQCMKQFREAEVWRSPSQLKEMNAKLMLVSRAAERDLAAAQKWAQESENCVRALAVVGKKFSDDLSFHEAEACQWRNPLDELAKP